MKNVQEHHMEYGSYTHITFMVYNTMFHNSDYGLTQII